MKTKCEITQEQLFEFYITKNYTAAKIAEEFKTSTATINRKLKDFGITKSEEQRRLAISQTKQNKTIDEKMEYAKHVSTNRKGKGLGNVPWNKGKHTGNNWSGKHHSEETKLKIKQTKENKSPEEKALIETKRLAARDYTTPWNKGKHTGAWPEEVKKEILVKQYKTKKQNNSFNSSIPEKRYYAYLCEKYSKDDIITQYSTDKRYPFACDFYIKSKDLFIELNFHWSHGGHLFDKTNINDLKKLDSWKIKATESKFYENAIETWTIRDVAKWKAAKENNLNYLVFYTEEGAINYAY